MTTHVMSTSGLDLENQSKPYFDKSYKKVLEDAKKNKDMNLISGKNPVPSTVFTFEVNI